MLSIYYKTSLLIIFVSNYNFWNLGVRSELKLELKLIIIKYNIFYNQLMIKVKILPSPPQNLRLEIKTSWTQKV